MYILPRLRLFCNMFSGCFVAYNAYGMKLTYETGTATLIQFIVLGILNIFTGLDSVVQTCRHDSPNCLENVFTSFVFYVLIITWFGIVCVIGYAAEQKRSRRLAQLLILAELLIAFVAFINIKLNLNAHNGLLSLFTSIADLILAIWIISLAFRLMRAGTCRVVTAKTRTRKRRKTTS